VILIIFKKILQKIKLILQAIFTKPLTKQLLLIYLRNRLENNQYDSVW